jgi:predicted metal-dependent hydrolase
MSEIQPRDLKFHVSDNAVRHWYRGDMATTALIDCFAVMLPVGERFLSAGSSTSSLKLNAKH